MINPGIRKLVAAVAAVALLGHTVFAEAAAAFKIVRMATPFAPFPPNIRRDTDLLVITRTWFFGQGDRIWTEARN